MATKKPTTRSSKPAKKPAVRRSQPKKTSNNKVDYYPNRMTVAVSALAGTLIVLFALIAVLGSQ